MRSPEVAKSRRRTWQEIAACFEAGVQDSGLVGWTELRDFARGLEHKPYAGALVTVGTLGSVLVFRGAEYAPEKGYVLIACSPTDRASDIGLGFFTTWEHPAGKLRRFRDAESAIEQFERQLADHDFIPDPREQRAAWS
jgi:hypothetical protein